jgi:tetratricopeptide (TPR) repeat protein
MLPSSRTPEGEPNLCPICGNAVRIEPSSGFRDAPCPHCGHLLRFLPDGKCESQPKTVARMRNVYERAAQVMAQESYDYNYVGELLTTCVLGDSANDAYVVAFVENLQKRYKNNRKGAPLASLKERATRLVLEKAEAAGRWDEVLKNALEILKENPWDVRALRALATAAKNAGDYLSEMRWLKFALEADPKDIDTNILCAKALEERGQFDQAIACWHRVGELRSEDDEPPRGQSLS